MRLRRRMDVGRPLRLPADAARLRGKRLRRRWPTLVRRRNSAMLARRPSFGREHRDVWRELVLLRFSAACLPPSSSAARGGRLGSGNSKQGPSSATVCVSLGAGDLALAALVITAARSAGITTVATPTVHTLGDDSIAAVASAALVLGAQDITASIIAAASSASVLAAATAAALAVGDRDTAAASATAAALALAERAITTRIDSAAALALSCRDIVAFATATALALCAANITALATATAFVFSNRSIRARPTAAALATSRNGLPVRATAAALALGSGDSLTISTAATLPACTYNAIALTLCARAIAAVTAAVARASGRRRT